MNRIRISDITMKQAAEGFNLSFKEKIELGKLLDKLGVSVIELEVKPDWVGKNLIELHLRKKYSINVVAIRKDDAVSVDIDPHAPLQAEDKLIVIANTEKLSKLK